MRAPPMHFVEAGLFSFGDEWVMGCEQGPGPWITKPVNSEVALGQV